MKRILQCLFGVSIVLVTGCANRHAVSLLEFENSNQRQIEKSISALDISPLLSGVSKSGNVIAVKSLEHPVEDGRQLNNAMIEDVIIQQLVEDDYQVAERNKLAVNALVQESDNETYSLNSHYQDQVIERNTLADNASVQENDNTIFPFNKLFSRSESLGRCGASAKSTTSLKSADYLLSYRILEMGTKLEELESSRVFQRNAMTKVHFRLQNTTTGLINEAESITSVVSDTIDEEDSPYFAQYHFESHHNQYPAISGILSSSQIIPMKNSSGFTLAVDAAWLVSSVGAATFGPQIKMGGYSGNTFIGGVVHIGWGNDFSLGGGMEVAYEIRAADIFAVGLGATAGFWWVESYNFYYSYDYNISDSYRNQNDFYFGGPVVNLRVGHENIFFNTDSSLKFGTGGIAYSVSAGVLFIF